MNRPLIWIILGIIAVLLALLLPPLLQRQAVRRSASALADAVRQANMAGVEAQILPAERSLARSLIGPLLPGHGASLRKFRVVAMDQQDDGSYSLRAIFNFEDPNWGRQIIEARMLMRLEAGQWYLSLAESEARQFSLTDSSGWTKATDWLNLAQP